MGSYVRCHVLPLLAAIVLVSGGPGLALAEEPAPVQPPPLQRVVMPMARLRELPDVDSHGYPVAVPDKLELVALIRAGEHERLDAFLAGLQADFERDFHKEIWMNRALEILNAGEPALLEPLDAWVAAMPESPYALLARGVYYAGVGWNARGTDAARRTSAKQFEDMAHAFEQAVEDLHGALERKPTLVAAYNILLKMQNSGRAPGEERTPQELFDAIVEISPYVFYPRQTYLWTMNPRWGGSYEAMSAFVAEAEALANRNPRLMTLRGRLLTTRAYTARLQLQTATQQGVGIGVDTNALEVGVPLVRKKPDERVVEQVRSGALALYDEALALGEFSFWYRNRARVYIELKQYARALADLNRAEAVSPQNPSTLVDRAEVLARLERYAEAQADLEVARTLRPHAIGPLWNLGYVLAEMGNFKGAAEVFAQALETRPNDGRLMVTFANALYKSGSPQEAIPWLEKAILQRPIPVGAHRLLGSVLADAGEYDRAKEALERALALDPRDREARHRLRYVRSQTEPSLWRIVTVRGGLALVALLLLVLLIQQRRGEEAARVDRRAAPPPDKSA